MELVYLLLLQLIQMVFVILFAPLVVGFIRKIKARLLYRKGPSIFQPYRDIYKLLHKETVLSEGASWFFRGVPYVIFAFIWSAMSLVPTFSNNLFLSVAADMIVIVGLLSSARFLLSCAGLSIGTSFGGIGASREMLISSFAEPAMLIIIFTLALFVKGSSTHLIFATFSASYAYYSFSIILLIISFFMVMLAENGRIPIDNPATHLELTMVHEAMLLEYSGRHLAMIEMASYLKLLLYISLFIGIFMPYKMAQDISVLAIVLGFIVYLVKVFFIAGFIATVETGVAKLRVFRVSEFLSLSLLFAFLSLVLFFVAKGF